MYQRDIYLDIDDNLDNHIKSVELDSNSRVWHFHLTVDYEPLDLTGKSVHFRAEKPDKTNVLNDCKIVDAEKGVVEVKLTRQVNAIPGHVKCLLKIIGDEGFVLKTKTFVVDVSKTLSDDAIVSSDEFGALEVALGKVQDIDNRFAQTNAQLSEMKKNASNVINVKEHINFNTDDIGVAINDIICNCNEMDIIRLGSGVYNLKTPININKRVNLELNGQIKYLGLDTEAIVLTQSCGNSEIFIHSLTGTRNTGIEIYNAYHVNLRVNIIDGFDTCLSLRPNKLNSNIDEGVQYCKFVFDILNGNEDCILLHAGDSMLPWVNENTFVGGRIMGKRGIRCVKGLTQIDPYNNNKFYNIGCEALTDTAVDLNFTKGNSFVNFRFENILGLWIKESSDSQYNRFDFSFPVINSKLELKGRQTYFDTYILDDDGQVISSKSILNMFNSANDSFHDKPWLNGSNLGIQGISWCDINEPMFDRFAMFLTDKNGVQMRIPSKELKTKRVINDDFIMDFLYRVMVIQSNERKVTITIPNKFKYDGATFKYSTNWCSMGIVFIDESGNIQFEHEPNILGTFECIYVTSYSKFNCIKVSDDRVFA